MGDISDPPDLSRPPEPPELPHRVHLYRQQWIGIPLMLLIPEILTEALNAGEASLTGAFIGVTTLLSLVFITSVLAYRSKRFGKWMEGEPVVLVQHGYLVPSAMHRERVSPQEVLSEMHKVGL